MKRRINFTHRKRILLEHVSVGVCREAGAPIAARMELDLSSYGFPSEAHIYLEAYRLSSLMRFHCGTVAEPTLPFGAALTELDEGDSVTFRVKVVDERDAKGKLLGVADGLRPVDATDESGSRIALLPTRHAELGELPWRVSFETVESFGVVLEVNRSIEDRAAFVSQSHFRQLVLPAVVREILVRALLVEDYRGPSSLEGWREDWVRFVCQTVPNGPDAPPAGRDKASILEWIDEAVDAFARAQRCSSKFVLLNDGGANGQS